MVASLLPPTSRDTIFACNTSAEYYLGQCWQQEVLHLFALLRKVWNKSHVLARPPLTALDRSRMLPRSYIASKYVEDQDFLNGAPAERASSTFPRVPLTSSSKDRIKAPTGRTMDESKCQGIFRSSAGNLYRWVKGTELELSEVR